MNRDRVVGLRPSREDILGFVLSVIASECNECGNLRLLAIRAGISPFT